MKRTLIKKMYPEIKVGFSKFSELRPTQHNVSFSAQKAVIFHVKTATIEKFKQMLICENPKPDFFFCLNVITVLKASSL